ncbi:MAG: hypothetical protein WDN50_01945 [Bradyrhizobium sp.]
MARRRWSDRPANLFEQWYAKDVGERFQKPGRCGLRDTRYFGRCAQRRRTVQFRKKFKLRNPDCLSESMTSLGQLHPFIPVLLWICTNKSFDLDQYLFAYLTTA